MVLYLGHKGRWNYPKNILGIVDVDDRLKPYVNDYKINLFEIAYLPEEKRKLFKSDFRVLADYLYQMQKNNTYEPEMYKIEHIDEVLNLMSAMTNDNRFEEIIEEVHEKEANYMCEVIDIMVKYLKENYGNPSSLYDFGYSVSKDINSCRVVISKYINCKAEEVFFNSCATEGNNTAIFGAISTAKGKNIVSTEIEHSSVFNVYKNGFI